MAVARLKAPGRRGCPPGPSKPGGCARPDGKEEEEVLAPVSKSGAGEGEAPAGLRRRVSRRAIPPGRGAFKKARGKSLVAADNAS